MTPRFSYYTSRQIFRSRIILPLSGSMRPPSGSRPQRPLLRTLPLLLVLLCTRESVRLTAAILGFAGKVAAFVVVVAVVFTVAIVTPGPGPTALLVVVQMVAPRLSPAGIVVAMGIRDVTVILVRGGDRQWMHIRRVKDMTVLIRIPGAHKL